MKYKMTCEHCKSEVAVAKVCSACGRDHRPEKRKAAEEFEFLYYAIFPFAFIALINGFLEVVQAQNVYQFFGRIVLHLGITVVVMLVVTFFVTWLKTSLEKALKA